MCPHTRMHVRIYSRHGQEKRQQAQAARLGLLCIRSLSQLPATEHVCDISFIAALFVRLSVCVFVCLISSTSTVHIMLLFVSVSHEAVCLSAHWNGKAMVVVAGLGLFSVRGVEYHSC